MKRIKIINWKRREKENLHNPICSSIFRCKLELNANKRIWLMKNQSNSAKSKSSGIWAPSALTQLMEKVKLFSCPDWIIESSEDGNWVNFSNSTILGFRIGVCLCNSGFHFALLFGGYGLTQHTVTTNYSRTGARAAPDSHGLIQVSLPICHYRHTNTVIGP